MPHDDHEDRRRQKEFEKFFVDHAGRVHVALRRSGADCATADDILQQAFLITFERWAYVRRYDYPAGFVWRVAVRLWVRHAKREKRRPGLELRSVGEAASSADFSQGHADLLDLEEALSRLPDQERAVIVLTYASGLDDSGIAEALGISLFKVRRSRRCAQLRLRDLLRRNDGRDGT